MTDELTSSDIPGLDLAAFRRWYDGERPGELGADLRGRLIAGGRSNLTYEVTDGASWWIVRRPPLGHVQATAHDMGREYTAMSALVPTAVPVPTTYAHCADPEVLGAPFYVMERVIGTAYRTATQLEPLGPERTATIARRMVDVLAALHAVDPAVVGLGEFGRPAGFLERQVRRWGRQLEGSQTREHPEAEELHRQLTARVPADDPAVVGIVHGDYRLDNLLTGDDDQIRAVVDWEMATLGDTRTDLALLLVYDRLSLLPGSGLVSDVSLGARLPAARESPRAVRRRQRPRPRRHELAPGARLLQARGDPRGHQLPLPAGPDRRRGIRPDRCGLRPADRGRTRRPPPRQLSKGTSMDFGFDDTTTELRERLSTFLTDRIKPSEAVFHEQLASQEDPWAWSTTPVLQELRAEARELGLWNLFLPPGTPTAPG